MLILLAVAAAQASSSTSMLVRVIHQLIHRTKDDAQDLPLVCGGRERRICAT